jgi:hypothetical protein
MRVHRALTSIEPAHCAKRVLAFCEVVPVLGNGSIEWDVRRFSCAGVMPMAKRSDHRELITPFDAARGYLPARLPHNRERVTVHSQSVAVGPAIPSPVGLPLASLHETGLSRICIQNPDGGIAVSPPPPVVLPTPPVGSRGLVLASLDGANHDQSFLLRMSIRVLASLRVSAAAGTPNSCCDRSSRPAPSSPASRDTACR